MSGTSTQTHDRLLYARVLAELGELQEAEHEVADILDSEPKNLSAFNLLREDQAHARGAVAGHRVLGPDPRAVAPQRACAHGARLHHAAGQGPRARRQRVRGPRASSSSRESPPRRWSWRRPSPSSFPASRPRRARPASVWRRPTAPATAICSSSPTSRAPGSPRCPAIRRRACKTLEQLGNHRGFETDADRVLALARIYERLGTTARLQQAVHIFRFFDRSFEKLSALGHLAVLYRKLERRAQAQDTRPGTRRPSAGACTACRTSTSPPWRRRATCRWRTCAASA